MPLSLTFISAGTYTIEDNGIPGDNTSVIRDGTGAIVSIIVHPADALNITATAPGVHIKVNFTDSLGAANFRIGDLANPAQSPASISIGNVRTSGTVVLAATGAITELGSDSGVDITAGALAMSAGTGIGTAANAIETRMPWLEAETNTGGINLSNLGSVQVGSLVADIDGLDVATSGDIRLSTVGTIFLSEGNSVTAAETVHGGGTSGNVTLIATGADADIIGNANNGAVTAPRGNIVLQAARDIGLGIVGADYNNDVLANGSVTFTAGRDISIDGFSDILSDNFGLNTGAGLFFTSGRNILINDAAGTSASVTASGSAGGDVVLTTGAGGMLIVNAPGTFAIGSTSGDVTVNADRIAIASDSGISAPAGFIAIRPVTAGREIVLGSLVDTALAIELSDAEFDRIFTSNLMIGNNFSGSISVLAAISAAIQNVMLTSAEDLIFGAGFSTTASLTLRAGNNFYQTGGTINTVTLNAFVDTLGNDDGGGLGRLTLVSGATTITLNGNAENDALHGAEGIDQIVHGNGGDDTITSSGEGRYFGDAGNDLIIGGLSSGLFPEILNGGTGIDTVDTTSFGGTYEINLTTGVTNFSFETYLNFENVITGDGVDEIRGTTGNNIIRTNAGTDTLFGLAGNDTLEGGADADTLNGGAGNDTYVLDGGTDTVIDSTGIDTITSTITRSLVAFAAIENLTLLGGALINGTGNALNNVLKGNSGANVLTGLAGNDTLTGGLGADTLNGGAGNDTYVLENGADTITDSAGIDRATSTITRSLVGFATIEGLTLLGANAINGTGNALNNTLTGNAKANILSGAAGNDVLNGMAGADTYTGGAGNDIFRFSNKTHSPNSGLRDTIKDFDDSGNDRIDVSALFGAAMTYRHDLAFTAAGQVRVLDIGGPDVIVQVNTGGSLAADFSILLKATTLASMTADDFVL